MVGIHETVAQAVHAYTYAAAYAEGEESLKGTLRPGELADLIILSDNIFQINPIEIEKVKVDLTVLGGQIIYERASTE